MSDSVDPLLDDLSNALENREYERVREITKELQRIYLDSRDTERETVNRSRALLTDPGSVSVDNIGEIAEITRVDGGTQMMRSLLLLTVAVLVESHEELREEGELERVMNTAKVAIEELRAAETDLAEATVAIQDTNEESSIPATLTIQSTSINADTVEPQTTVSLSTTVKNTGAQPANEVEILVQPTGNVNVSETSIFIRSLDAGDSVTRETEVRASTVGTHMINVVTRGDEANPDRSTAFLTVNEGVDGTTSGDHSDGGGGGFGMGAALSAIGGTGYLLKRRLGLEEQDSED